MASCGECGAKRGHLAGCSRGGRGGGEGTPAKRGCKKGDHNWVWKERRGGFLSRPYDVYVCTKCDTREERNV